MLHQIGAGALGPVFRAYEPDRERLVAIKLFRLDLPPQRVHQFVTELERLIAAELTHTGIASPLAAGVDGNTAYLVQEFVAADSLDIVVRDHGPVPPVDTARLAVQLAGALDFAAAVNITNGALHPRDVLVSPDEARVTGLGVARALEQVGVAAPIRRPYTSPERIAGTNWDRRADIFSLAAIFYEILWGQRIAGAGQQVAESLGDLPGADLMALRAAFARALAEDPGDRFETALEFAGALKAAFHGIDARQATVEPAPPIAPRLPLDGPSEADATPLDAAADLDLRADSTVVEPPIGRELGFAPASAPDHEPPMTRPPAGMLDLDGPEPTGSALDRSRSAVWPLALALLVGLAVGFAGGYGVGSRDRPPPIAVPSTPDAGSAQAAAPAREWTEGAVNDPLKAAPSRAPGATGASTSALALADGRTPPGHLLVRSTPPGARVFVDGRDRGRTPATIRNLARGTHRVRLVHQGYATEERRVTITASQPDPSMSVTLAPTRAPEPTRAPAAGAFFGSLSVESRPIGAKVFVDGRAVGTTPMVLPQIGAGEHVVQLEHDGYHRWSSSVRIVGGERNRITASLERGG